MRSILIGILACVFGIGARAESGLASLLGPPAQIIERLEALAQQHDYSAIYRLLGREYRTVVTEEYFVGTSEKLSWTFEKLDYGRLDMQKHFAWLPVKGIVRLSENREVRFYTVVFFGEEDGEWKMLTFPFLCSPYLRDMGVIPRWIVEADEQYGK